MPSFFLCPVEKLWEWLLSAALSGLQANFPFPIIRICLTGRVWYEKSEQKVPMKGMSQKRGDTT